MKIYSPLPPKVQQSYFDIFNDCLTNHHWNGSYYNRGLLYFQQGDFFNAIEDISKYLASQNSVELTKELIKAKYHEGSLQNLMGKYHEAIETLGQVIDADPSNQEAVLERAIAYFETGNFELALKDFIKSEIKPTRMDESFHSLEFSGGIVMGLCSGASHTLKNFIPSMMCSLQGLANGIWSFAIDPKDVSLEILQTCRTIYGMFSDNTVLETLKTIIPEVKELGGWKNISEFKKGELVGGLIGKYGLDTFLMAGSVKGIKVFQELRRANAIMTLETMTSLEKMKTLEGISGQWKNSVSKEIETIKAGGLKQDKELYRKYRDQVLSEHQVRKILHEAGYKTFPRPKNIPSIWKVEISQKGGGMKYKAPNGDTVRIQPGIPNSEHACQRRPYVVHQTMKGRLDKYGNIVKNESIESHIPVEEYDFINIVKGHPYE